MEVRPLLRGGSGVHSFDRDQPAAYPTRLEAGTLNSHGLAGLHAALEYLLAEGVESLYARFSAEPDVEPIEEAEEEQPTDYEDAPEGTRNFTFVVKDGEIYYCEKNKLIPQPYTGMKAARIKGLCEIRTALLEVISIQSREYDPLDLRKAQDKLNQAYDRFPAK